MKPLIKLKFLFWKLLRGVSLLWGLSVLSFVMLYYSSIDPINAYLGGEVTITAEQRAALEEYWGLNDPPHEQYLTWLKHFVSGDMGVSKVQRRPVGVIIKEKFVASFLLMGLAWGFFREP